MDNAQTDPELHPLEDIDQVIRAPARLMVLACLYVVESADYVFLARMAGLTWGNLSTHLSRLEEAGYVAINKQFRGKKPHTTISLTEQGRPFLQLRPNAVGTPARMLHSQTQYDIAYQAREATQ